MRALVVAVVVCFTSTALAADETKLRVAAAKAMLAAQTKALIADDTAAWKATLTSDARVSRGAEFESRDDSFQLTLTTPDRITLANTKIGWSGTWGWIATELRVT